jgi:ribosomal protein S18 acetylase RimI-like enzyme
VDSTEHPITALRVEDAGELLTLQRAAYVTEAQAHDDPHLPPLLETLDQVRADLRSDTTTVLGMRDRGRLVGTVRVRHDPADRGAAEIARLAVAPDRQGEGLGTRLLVAAEQHVSPEATTLTLFTGEHSHGNLRLYERQGYTENHRSPAGTHELVHMRKTIG